MDAAGALVRFSKWILAATAFTALSQRAGVFLLGYFEVAPEEQSRFGAAFTIALAADLLVISFFTTLLPRASAATDPAARRTFVRAMTGPSALLAAAVLAGIPLSGIAVAVAYAGRYPGAGGLLAILLAGAAPMLLSTPFSTAMFSAGRPQWIAALEGLKLAMTVAAGAWAAPRFGALGAAWAVTGAKAATACLTAAVSIYVLARDG
jgi:O-antigen/teichoic acid export membrane protein